MVKSGCTQYFLLSVVCVCVCTLVVCLCDVCRIFITFCLVVVVHWVQ